MNDLINNGDNAATQPEAASAPQAETATVATTTKVDDISKAYFPSEKLAEAQTEIEKVNAICSEHELAMVFNFDTEAEFPTGYGIALVPIAKRINNENKTLGVAIAAIPDVATVQQHEGGQQFVTDSVIGAMVAKLANSVRPRGEDNETASSIPYTVSDFITSNRAEGVLLAFRKLASDYVKVLKGKGLKFMTESILRQTLQSAAFAEQKFPKVDQATWEKLLDSMIARAEKEELAPGMLNEWKKTRASAELKDEDVDLSDLDFDAVGNDS